MPFHRVHRIFLVSLLKLKFKDAQTAAGLVERQVGNNILHNQIQSLINGDQVLKGNSCLASTSMLPRPLNCCKGFFTETLSHCNLNLNYITSPNSRRVGCHLNVALEGGTEDLSRGEGNAGQPECIWNPDTGKVDGDPEVSVASWPAGLADLALSKSLREQVPKSEEKEERRRSKS